jgi:hypothetical protein
MTPPPTAPLAALGLAVALHLPGACAPATRPDGPPAAAVAADGATPRARPGHAAPPEVLATLPDARPVGRGSLRMLGLPIYEAQLWAASGFQAETYDRHPFALVLTYARRLDGTAIAERSVAEMRRVSEFSDAQALDWLALMRQAFPSVAAHDRLVGVHDGHGGVRFYFNGRPTAQTVDRDYARLFFGIWLARQTAAPALRQALLGASG